MRFVGRGRLLAGLMACFLWTFQAKAQSETLLLSIEVNGVQASRGSSVIARPPHACLVELESVLAHVDPRGLPTEQHEGTTFLSVAPHWGHCSIDAETSRALIRMNHEHLRPRPLVLGERPAVLAPLHLIHAQAGISAIRTTQPVRTIPSLALDAVLHNRGRNLGIVASQGPLQLQAREAQSPGQSRHTWSLEHGFPSGAALTAGDQVMRVGILRAPVAHRGLSWSSRMAPLQSASPALGQFTLESPARVQFVDNQGTTLYSTSLLPAGRYALEGFGASGRPGVLNLEVLGLDGERKTLQLPWVSSPSLLQPGETLTEAFVGRGGFTQGYAAAGLTLHESLRLGFLRRAGLGHEVFFGASSARQKKVLASLDIGLSCAPQCAPQNRLQLQMQLSRGVDLLLEASQPRQRILALQAGLSSATHASINLSSGSASANPLFAERSSPAGQAPQQSVGSSQLASLSHRISPALSVQLQLRVSNGAITSRSAFLSLNWSLDQQHSVGASLQQTQGQPLSLGLAASRRPTAPEGDTIQLIQREGSTTAQELLLRSERAYGDLHVLARQNAGQPVHISTQAASRLWITEHGLHLGPVGQYNLVLHELGLPGPQMRQDNGLVRAADASGIVPFARVPSWSRPSFEVDTRRLPFWMTWRGGRLALPMAAQRAYWVDHRGSWSVTPNPRLALQENDLQTIERVLDRLGQPITLSPDGYLDLANLQQLPVTVQSSSGIERVCQAEQSVPKENGDLLLICRSQQPNPPLRSASATPHEGHIGRHDGHELNVGL